VRPPAAEFIEVLSGSLAVLNLRCSRIVSDKIKDFEDWNLVINAYEKAEPGQPAVGNKKVKFTQHCEITLALDMLSVLSQNSLTEKSRSACRRLVANGVVNI
jgi:hypothetical protein